MNSTIVNLNVGGKIFTTFRSTLEKAGPDTYFYKLYNSEISKKTLDKDGNIFLDHDPDTFGFLLHLLRDDEVLKNRTRDESTQIYNDSNYMERIEQFPDEYVNSENYRGGMKRNEKHSYGFEKTADGFYEGYFVNGQRHGHGILLDSEGYFEGVFSNDQIKKGKYEWPNGDHFEGEFQNELRHGKGKYKWSDGEIYEGDWFKDQQHGKGKYQTKNFIYEGEFKNDMMHGKGKKVYNDGRVEKGIFKKDKFYSLQK